MNAALKIKNSHLSLDGSLLQIIDKAVVETFNSFMGITPKLKNSEMTLLTPLSDRYDISGIISFIQDSIEGSLALRFRLNSALKLMSRIYGEEITSVDNRVIGGVAEFANVIHGIIKDQLNQIGHHYQMCLPVVVIGDNHSVVNALSGEKLILKYDLEGDEATLELVLHNQITSIGGRNENKPS